MKFRHDICKEREREEGTYYLDVLFLLPLAKGGGLLDSSPVMV